MLSIVKPEVTTPEVMGVQRRTLFTIAEDVLALEDLLERAGGDISDPDAEAQIDAFMQSLGIETERKVDSYCALIKYKEAMGKVRRDESARLASLAQADENCAARLKTMLKWFMETIRKADKMETPRFKIGIQNNGGKQALTTPEDAEKLPERFRIAVYIPNDAEIRAALAAGETVPGCSLAPRGNHLRVR